MSFFDAIKSCFTQYVGFSGRARRKEYWYFILFNILLTAVVGIIATATGASFLSGICGIALFLPGIAVTIRRLHDTGKAGAWILLSFIPIVGNIILLIWFCKDSDPSDNQYGPNPKANEGAQF